jgi:hypothetical protein
MIAGIMQPYFFPYFGYFDHIFRCDVWVVFDITSYRTKSWMSRNRILHPQHEWFYINCPVHGSSNRLASEIRITDINVAQEKILGQLSHYKNHAPYYFQVTDLVRKVFSGVNSDSLVEINVQALNVVCDYLNIPFSPIIASKAEFPLPEIMHAGQWALEICSIIGVDTYLNPPGGKDLFRPEEFAERNIRLGFIRVPSFSYNCAPYSFEPHLSILDVLMWNPADAVRAAMGKEKVDYM